MYTAAQGYRRLECLEYVRFQRWTSCRVRRCFQSLVRNTSIHVALPQPSIKRISSRTNILRDINRPCLRTALSPCPPDKPSRRPLIYLRVHENSRNVALKKNFGVFRSTPSTTSPLSTPATVDNHGQAPKLPAPVPQATAKMR